MWLDKGCMLYWCFCYKPSTPCIAKVSDSAKVPPFSPILSVIFMDRFSWHSQDGFLFKIPLLNLSGKNTIISHNIWNKTSGQILKKSSHLQPVCYWKPESCLSMSNINVPPSVGLSPLPPELAPAPHYPALYSVLPRQPDGEIGCPKKNSTKYVRIFFLYTNWCWTRTGWKKNPPWPHETIFFPPSLFLKPQKAQTEKDTGQTNVPRSLSENRKYTPPPALNPGVLCICLCLSSHAQSSTGGLLSAFQWAACKGSASCLSRKRLCQKTQSNSTV